MLDKLCEYVCGVYVYVYVCVCVGGGAGASFPKKEACEYLACQMYYVILEIGLDQATRSHLAHPL